MEYYICIFVFIANFHDEHVKKSFSLRPSVRVYLSESIKKTRRSHKTPRLFSIVSRFGRSSDLI